MKSLLFAGALLLSSSASLWAQPAIGHGVNVAVVDDFTDGDHTGKLSLTGITPPGGELPFTGTYDYWWFCVQDDGSNGPGTIPGGYEANLTSILHGWGHQYIGRSTESGTQGLAKQATIIGYLLDTFLPAADAGLSGSFSEIVGNPETDNVDFFNSFDAISYYVKQMFPFSPLIPGSGLERTDFVTWEPTNPYDNATPANAARQEIFNNIVTNVRARETDDNTPFFFDSYVVQGEYAIVNTEEDHQASPDVAQDVLIILKAAPIPEPSAALLGLGSLVLLAARRRRA